MIDFFHQISLLSSISVVFRVQEVIKIVPIKHTLGLLRFLKNSRFLKIIQAMSISGENLSGPRIF